MTQICFAAIYEKNILRRIKTNFPDNYKKIHFDYNKYILWGKNNTFIISP